MSPLRRHVVLLHDKLLFAGGTARLVATARVLADGVARAPEDPDDPDGPGGPGGPGATEARDVLEHADPAQGGPQRSARAGTSGRARGERGAPALDGRHAELAPARVTIVAGDGSQRPILEREGHAVVPVDLPLEPWRNPFAAQRVARLVAGLEPDVVHVTSERLAALAAWIALFRATPYVLEVHRPLTGLLPRRSARLAAVGLSSPTLAVSAVNQGRVPRALLVEVPHAPEVPPGDAGVATAFARPAALYEERVRIGMAGLLDERHDTEVFLSTAGLLRTRHPNLHFVVLGEGPREAALRRLVRREGLADRVTIGVPVTAAPAQMLRSFDVHVSCRVGGPDWLTHLALALGIPSILAASGIAFELIEDGVDGVLVAPKDPVALAVKIEELIEVPLAARALGRAARARWQVAHPPGAFARSLAALHARTEAPVEA